MSRAYKDLIAWQRGMDLARQVYELTASFPLSERYCLSDQLRRSAISVPSNIAEGFGRISRGEYIQFLGHSRGSANEIETQLLLAQSLRYGEECQILAAQKLCAEVGRLLNGLIHSLRNTNSSDSSRAAQGRRPVGDEGGGRPCS